MDRKALRKPILSVAGVVLAVIFSCAYTARAEIITGDKMYFGDWSGGSVTSYPIAPSNFTPFQTYCAEVEAIIYVNMGSAYAYQVTEVGYSNDGTDKNTMTPQTAWLYTAFLDNTLPNYTDDVRHQQALQYGIWNSLGYTDARLTALGEFNQQAHDDYYSFGWNVTPASWSGYGDIRIAQLQTVSDGSMAQDVLVSVPEPATMSLMALGGILLMWRRRNRTIRAA